MTGTRIVVLLNVALYILTDQSTAVILAINHKSPNLFLGPISECNYLYQRVDLMIRDKNVHSLHILPASSDAED